MNATLNAAQRDLLRLIFSSYHAGCVVYGRGYAATAEALKARDLIRIAGHVHVVSMGKLETRDLWRVTASGEAVAQEMNHATGTGTRSPT
jgi:hypothetical protein